jgi:dolichol-phosphate mannosyltransferase
LRHMPYIRRMGNLGLSFLTKVASGYWNIFDPTNGYTAIGANALRSLNFERLSKRYFFETSMLLELGLQRMVVKDIYIPAIYGDESSKLSNLKALFEFPPKLFLGMLRRIIFLYFIRDLTAVSIFSIAGIVSVIFGSLWGIYHWWRSSVTGVEASTGTVMIAILPLILGIQFLLQAVGMDIQNTPQKDGWGR